VAGASLDAEGHPQLVLDAEALAEHVCRAGPAPAAEPAPRTPILIIDDSLTTRMLEQSILESAGYEVDLATSGEEGLVRARARRYALFLVDVEMPGMDGFTFIERTREDPALRDTPAVLVTSRDAPEDRRRGQSAGARAYIVKGEFDQTELLDKIRHLVGMQ
jgi:two-component system chemotaxis sensor kinase CheA